MTATTSTTAATTTTATVSANKKSRNDTLNYNNININNNNNNHGTANEDSNNSDSVSLFISQQHLETVLAELEYERKMRQIDQTRSQQMQDRLAQELTLVKKQFQDTSVLLQQVQEESDRITSELRSSRNSALSELQRVKMLLQQANQHHAECSSSSSSSPLFVDSHQVWKEKCRRLQEQIQAQAENEQRMKHEMDVLKQQMQEQLEQLTHQVATTQSNTEQGLFADKAMEEAPSALLKELNRTRVELAETSRQNRQLLQRHDSLQQRNRKLIQDQEEGRSSKARLVVVEQKLSDLQLKYEESKAKIESWTVFGKTLKQELDQSSNKKYNLSSEDESGIGKTSCVDDNDGVPPEVTTVLRYLETAQSQLKELKDECQRKQKRVDFLTSTLEMTEDKLKHSLEQLGTFTCEKKELQAQLNSYHVRVAMLENQQSISHREVDSLRALLQTFDNMPLLSPTATNQSDILASPKLQTSLKTLQVRYESCQEELDLVRKDRDRLSSELETLQSSHKELQQELDRVKEKFGKLRDALQAERSKVERAEERANAAEALAGKGSFNPDKVRALHFKDTPLIEALREEISVLKRQLEAATAAATGGGGGDDNSTTKSASKRGSGSSILSLDHEKVSQRLKEKFKEQIGLFREGVYLMTGFKVDMLSGTERPTFRVRSVFAEHEEDHLILQWPKSEPVVSLDILETDFAKQLATTDSHHYMVKFQSLPAFMASVQLSLFEQQTLLT